MDDKSEAPAPKARARDNSVAVDDKDRGRKAPAKTPDRAPEPNPSSDPGKPGVEKTQKVPSVEAGDLPDAVRRRYYANKARWSGDPAYFTTANTKDPAFRDQGRRLVTATESQEVVKDLVAIAQHRGWDKIHVTGTEAFRRSVWLEASQKGVEVRGYKPNDRDLQELDRLRSDGSRNTIAPVAMERAPERGDAPSPTGLAERSNPNKPPTQAADSRSASNDRAAESQMRVMEAVIRRTLFENPEAVTRVMAVARAQLDAHIAAGKTIRPAVVHDKVSMKKEIDGAAAPGLSAGDRRGREPKPPERHRSR